MSEPNTPAPLTWHKGSVLPFASLWHTVIRVAALNSLRMAELPLISTRVGPVPPGSVELLYNGRPGEASAIDVITLAQSLNEPVSVFDWSHLGWLPLDMQFVGYNSFRICRKCMTEGFHSSLFSVRLLEVCPMHGNELITRCNCGRPFEARITAQVLSRVGHCACGKLSFFTRDTCRRPILRAQDLVALRPVADWLTNLTRVGVSRFFSNNVNEAKDRLWRGRAREWCDALEIGYPDCFVVQPRGERRRVVSTCTKLRGPLNETIARRAGDDDSVFDEGWSRAGRYWDRNPATFVYRSMLRYLRRHVTRGGERFALEFLELPNPLRMATVMREEPVAKAVFAEMLFCDRLEQNVMRRRWPYRQTENTGGGWWFCKIEPPFVSWLATHDTRHARRWIEYQASRNMLLAEWREAQRLAIDAIRTGIAHWERTVAPDAHEWSVVLDDGSIRFVCIEDQVAQDWALPLPDKPKRKAIHDLQMHNRLEAIVAACSGHCLTRDFNGEWGVSSALKPTKERVDLHRLLRVGRRRPAFWLFESGEAFVARMCDIPLQAVARSPTAAIQELRVAFNQYRQIYPRQRDEPRYVDVAPQPIRDQEDEICDTRLRWIAHRYGFWRGAEMIQQEINRSLTRDTPFDSSR